MNPVRSSRGIKVIKNFNKDEGCFKWEVYDNNVKKKESVLPEKSKFGRVCSPVGLGLGLLAIILRHLSSKEIVLLGLGWALRGKNESY